MKIDNSTNLKKGAGISLLPAMWAQIDAWVNIASSAKANGPRITRGDVVGEMAAYLGAIGWKPGMKCRYLTMTAALLQPAPELKNGVVATRPAKSRK